MGISLIHSYLYCPYQLYLDRVKKVEVETVSRKDMLLWWYYSKEIKRLLGVSS